MRVGRRAASGISEPICRAGGIAAQSLLPVGQCVPEALLTVPLGSGWDGGEGLGRAVRSALFSSGHDAVCCWEHSPALSGFRFFMENGDDLFAAVPDPRGTGHILLTFVCLALGTRSGAPRA